MDILPAVLVPLDNPADRFSAEIIQLNSYRGVLIEMTRCGVVLTLRSENLR